MNDSIWNILEVILILAVVFYLAWFVTRFVASKSKGNAKGRFMQIVDRLNISNDKSVLLVRMGGEYCVLGVTGHEIRLIKTLEADTAEALGELATMQAAPAGGAADLLQGLKSFWSKTGFATKKPEKAPPPDPQATQPEEQSVIDLMNERIKLRQSSRRQ